jgi:hypothetical protein
MFGAAVEVQLDLELAAPVLSREKPADVRGESSDSLT